MAAKKDLEPQVLELLNETKPGMDAHDARTPRYDKSYEVYRASAPGPRDLPSWQARLRVPYAMQISDTVLVNIIGGPPRVKVRPRIPGKEQSAKKMQVALDYYMYKDRFVAKQAPFVQQGIIYGVTAAKNHWLYRESDRLNKRYEDDPFNPERQLTQVVQERVVLQDGPTFEPWDIYDCWWDPNGRDANSCSYVILRSWLSKAELEANRYDPETGQGLYENLDELYRAGTRRRTGQTAQERFLGGNDNLRKDKFEVWEVWKNDRLCVLGNRQIKLREIPNPYWHGEKPVVIAATRPDTFKVEGIPETELVDHLQQALWTLQNMRMDNLKLTVMRGITYREGGVTDPNALELKPRFKWPVTDHDDIRPFEVQPLAGDVYREDDKLLAQMQLVTGINPYVSGSDTQGVDQNTATGVTALQEVASRLLRFKARMIMYQGYQPSFEQWGQMIQQLLDKEQDVRIQGQGDEFTWEKFTPQDVAGEFDYLLEGSEESLSRQQERGEAIALLNAFAPFAQLGIVNLPALLKKVATAYNFDNPEELIANTPPQQPAAAPMQQQPPLNGQPQQLMGGQAMPAAVGDMIGSGYGGAAG